MVGFLLPLTRNYKYICYSTEGTVFKQSREFPIRKSTLSLPTGFHRQTIEYSRKQFLPHGHAQRENHDNMILWFSQFFSCEIRVKLACNAQNDFEEKTKTDSFFKVKRYLNHIFSIFPNHNVQHEDILVQRFKLIFDVVFSYPFLTKYRF